MAKSNSTRLSGHAKDETGNVYGKLTVMEYAGVRHDCVRWTCRCECGKTRIVSGAYLRRATSTLSCGKCDHASSSSGLSQWAKDERGHVYGKLTVVEYSHTKGEIHWLCKCECGKTTTVQGSSLRKGDTTSCGCVRGFKDETGNVYDKLTVMERFHNGKPGAHWLCRCECGNTTVVSGGNLRAKNYKHRSCIKCRNVRHGKSGTSEYTVWKSMRKRCKNKNNDDYQHYGGRGIAVCERWETFENFLEDMGTRPFPNAEVERRDNNSGYEKSNCYWATHKQQMRNTRNNALLTHNGKTQCMSAWCEELGLNIQTVNNRLHRSGWSVEKTLTTPVRQRAPSLRGNPAPPGIAQTCDKLGNTI